MTVREAVPYGHRVSRTLELLAKPGLLLATTTPGGESTVTTLG